MKLITEIDDDIIFMRTLYRCAEKALDFVTETRIVEIRSNRPKFTGEETAEEKKKLIAKQSIENLKLMLKSIMEEHPQDAIDLAKEFIALDDGEEYPHGIRLFTAMMKCFNHPDVIDFFTQFAGLGQLISG